jgi:surface protein
MEQIMFYIKSLGFKTIATILFGLGLIGCGGGSDATSSTTSTSATIQEAQLIDSAIEGVEYTTNSLSGITTDTGTFQYNPTDTTITFKAGSLTLAGFNLSRLDSDKKLLPADIFGLSRENTTDANLLKFIRVVQSLDNDNDPSNGILIDDNTKGFLATEIDIKDANLSQLKTMVEGAGKTFKLERSSRDHYKTTLVSMGISPEFTPFVTVWTTIGTTTSHHNIAFNDRNITIPTNPNYTYNYTVDWGDGHSDTNITGDKSHLYAKDGNYTIKIYGTFPAIYNNSGDIDENPNQNAWHLMKVTSWGDIEWKSMEDAFSGCFNVQVEANDIPITSAVISMKKMYYYATSFNHDLDNWDVSNVVDMSALFYNATDFNGTLKNWNVSKAIDMNTMFTFTKFNSDITDWNVSNVTNMEYMFGATPFNQDIGNWNVSNVTNMRDMFDTTPFNQDISDWNVSNVTNMQGMFIGTPFNQDIGDWNTSSVVDMGNMFGGAGAFNQDISGWDTSSVTDMHAMFSGATAFNQDISGWDTSRVVSMGYMLYGASNFTNHDLSGWNVGNVTDHTNFMTNAGSGNTEPNWP